MKCQKRQLKTYFMTERWHFKSLQAEFSYVALLKCLIKFMTHYIYCMKKSASMNVHTKFGLIALKSNIHT